MKTCRWLVNLSVPYNKLHQRISKFYVSKTLAERTQVFLCDSNYIKGKTGPGLCSLGCVCLVVPFDELPVIVRSIKLANIIIQRTISSQITIQGIALAALHTHRSLSRYRGIPPDSNVLVTSLNTLSCTTLTPNGTSQRGIITERRM